MNCDINAKKTSLKLDAFLIIHSIYKILPIRLLKFNDYLLII